MVYMGISCSNLIDFGTDIVAGPAIQFLNKIAQMITEHLFKTIMANNFMHYRFLNIFQSLAIRKIDIYFAFDNPTICLHLVVIL